MKKFYERLSDSKYYEIELEETNLIIKTRYGKFDYNKGTKAIWKSTEKQYKTLATAQRNFDKRCTKLEDKNYELSDEDFPLAIKKQLEHCKAEKEPRLLIEITHDKIFEEVFKLKHLEHLALAGIRDGLTIPESLSNLKKLKIFAAYGGFVNLPDSICELKKVRNILVSHMNGRESQVYKLPESICRCPNLKRLDVSQSQLRSLPKNIGEAKSLITLNLSYTPIKELPESIGKCTNLENLTTCNCTAIEKLPASIGKLANLRDADFSYCSLKTFPIALTELSKLEGVDLTGNYIAALPEEIGKLKNLVYISLSNNINAYHASPNIRHKVKVLPKSLGELKKLEALTLSHNHLTKLPAFFANLENLEYLGLYDNRFKELPEVLLKLPKLQTLNIAKNPWKNKEKVKMTLEKMPNLEQFYLD